MVAIGSRKYLAVCRYSISDTVSFSQMTFTHVIVESQIYKTILYNVCSVPWTISWVPCGMFSTVGGYLEYCRRSVGVILSTVGGGGRLPYHDTFGGIISTVGGVQYQGEISGYVWRIFSTPTFIMIPHTLLNIPQGTAHTNAGWKRVVTL